MYNEDLSMQMYSMRLGEYIWNKIVETFDCEDIKKIDNGEMVLNEKIIEQIIHNFGGTYVNFSRITDNSVEDLEKIEQRMRVHLQEKYDEENIKGNSYFVKTSDDNNFEIGCKHFKLMDCVHELGHLFLNLDTLEINKPIWSDESISKSEYMVDTFGRAFVMPRDRFLRIVTIYSELSECDIYSVAKTFGVEYIHAYIRGKELMLWD